MLQKEAVAAGLGQSTARGIAGSLQTGITAGTTQTQAGATPLTAKTNVIGTVGTTNDGVILPVVDPLDEVFVRNAGANTAKVYPPVGGSINGGSANAAVTLAAGASARYRYTSTLDSIT